MRQVGVSGLVVCGCSGLSRVARSDRTATSIFWSILRQVYDLFELRLPLAARLEEIIGRRVDLISEHELSRHLQRFVLAEAIELLTSHGGLMCSTLNALERAVASMLVSDEQE